MKRILAAFARNTVFANILLVMILVIGGLSAKKMIRETFPQFSLDMINISVSYPGADPEEIEEGINQKIEEALEGVEGIKQVTTKAMENRGSTLIEVKENYDVKTVLDDIRSRINAISTFPADAEAPVINELVVKDPVVLLDLSGRMDERRLKEWAERMKDDIRSLPAVSQVSVFGTRDYEIAIEVSEARLQEYGLTFKQVADAIKRSNLNLAGGTIRTEGEEIRVRTIGRKYTGADLAQVVVIARPDGDLITLDRLATIHDGFTEDPVRATIDGKPSVMLLVYKTTEEDALAISSAIHGFIEKARAQLPPGAEIKVLYDNTDMLRARIDLLVKNGLYGLMIVFLSLWLFLNARLSFWAGMGVPISIAGALGVLYAIGGTVNMVSLFGLILVLGILVDDAIVVGDAIYEHRKRGKPPLQAAVEGVSEVGMPVIAAVATTIAAFVPLAYVGGIMGKFIAILPEVVIACLVMSTVECLFMLPAHLSHLPDPNRPPDPNDRLFRYLNGVQRLTSRGMERFVERVYAPFLARTLRWRYVSLATAIAILMLAIGMVKGGILKFEVFPPVDGFVVTSTVEFPAGTPSAVTADAVHRIEAALLRLNKRMKTTSGRPMVENRLSIVGQSLGQIPTFGPNIGAVQAILIPSEERGIHSQDIMVAWEKETGRIPGATSLTYEGMSTGPPGAPIEVWLQGHDMDEIIAASKALMARLATFDGVYQIHSDFTPGKNEMRLRLKPEARTLGLTVEDLARQVNSGFYGDEALRVQRGREDVRIKVRYTESERSRLSDLENIRIRTRDGMLVPLQSVADIHFSPGYATITRTDGMRRVAVSADVDSNRANASEIFAELNRSYFPTLERDYPGIRVALQGEQKKMRESFDSLDYGFPLAILGIFIIIATMFRSYIQPFVILTTIPFGIIGAVVSHLLFGYVLSIMSVFGIVALTGVVVNDAIVFIERINENLAEGMRFKDAVVNAGRRRFRAIFLTSISTVGGLGPLILETDLQAKFLIPMALALAGGVAFATIQTLVLIPSLMTILNDIRRLVYRLRHGQWPTREMVEPARTRRHDPMIDGSENPPAPIVAAGMN